MKPRTFRNRKGGGGRSPALRVSPLDLLPSALRGEEPYEVVDIRRVGGFPGSVAGFEGMAQDTRTGRIAHLLGVPGGDSAFDRTVRLHEALHANLPDRPRRPGIPEMVWQAVNDLQVHTKEWPGHTGDSPSRDALACALRDLRTAVRLPKRAGFPVLRAHPLSRASWVVSTVRALGIARTCYRPGKREFQFSDWLESLSTAYGAPVMPLYSAASLAAYGRYEEAEDILKDFLSDPLPTDSAPGEGKGKKGDKKGEDAPGKGHRSGSYDPVAQAATDADRETLESLDARTKAVMDILELPRTAWTDRGSYRAKGLASRGSRLVPKRLVPCVVRGTTDRLFRRITRRPAGGTVLIDASGSMPVDPAILASLCRCAPAATVAYYSGDRNGPAAHGVLTVYAKGGRRHEGDTVPIVGPHNTIDYYALRWALALPGPVTVVTDGGFGGGPDGQAETAMRLLRDAVSAGKATWVRTVAEARTLFEEEGGDAR